MTLSTSQQAHAQRLLASEKKLLAELEILHTKQAEQSLSEFTKQAWHLIEPETKLKWNWHLDTICGYLEATVDPESTYFINRLIINVPPGSLKSILVSVMFPAWLWVKRPSKRVLGISNIQDLSIRDSRRTKIIIMSDWFQNRWPLELMADQSAKTNYENVRGGFRGSLGMTGNITGKRGDYLLIDDPHDATTVQSDTQRANVLEVYDSMLSSRVNSQEESVIIVIMQRLHHLDLTGHLLSKVKTKWVHVVMPMHFDYAFTFNSTKDLGRPELDDPRRKNGLLFPAIFPEPVVEKLEEDLGEYHCTPPGSPVLMADMTERPIEDVHIGDRVMAYHHHHLDINRTGWQGHSAKRIRAAIELDPGNTKPALDTVFGEFYYPNITKMDGRYIPPNEELTIENFEKFCRDAKGPEGEAKRRRYKRHVEKCRRKSLFTTHYNNRGVLDKRFVSALVIDTFTYEGPIYEVTMKNGDVIKCTKDHKWFRPGFAEAKALDTAPYYSSNPDGMSFMKIVPGYKVTGHKNTELLYDEDKNGKPIPTSPGSDTLLGQYFYENVAFTQIKSFRPLGRSKIHALETTTGSYIVWGMASSNSAGQLEQRPSPKSGGILRQNWFRVLDETSELPVCDHVFVSCDTAYSERDRKSNSFSAFTTWGVFWNKAQQRDCMLLLDVWFDRVDYPDLRRKAIALQKDKKPDLFLIEKKASGISLVQDLQRAGIFVRTYTPTTDKVSRAYAIQPMLESGQVWIADRKWAHYFAYLMGSFPTGIPESNDLADTFTQAALYIRNGFYVSHPDDEDELEAAQKQTSFSPYGSRNHAPQKSVSEDTGDSFVD